MQGSAKQEKIRLHLDRLTPRAFPSPISPSPSDRKAYDNKRLNAGALAGGGGGVVLDKYVKKKKLDPLDAYVPAIILTQLQIEDLGEFDVKLLKATTLNLLSADLFSVQALQHLSVLTSGRALEEQDSLLLHASRKEPDASVSSMKAKIDVAVNALDSLLRTVPENILDKGKAITDAYRSPANEEPELLSDPKIKRLESIL